jgi:thioredoxin-dependent peroxiredoxin
MTSPGLEIPIMKALAKLVLSAGFVLVLTPAHPASATPPRVGDAAPDFTLQTPAGESIRLAPLNEKGQVVLVVLRGWPGYQCPICTRQVGELISKSKEFAAAKARVVLVYPGPSAGLKEHAEEFARGKALPDNFYFVLDPDYAFTRSYDLRWEAPGETAYPSTFVIDSTGKIRFAKTSRTHGDRARTEDVIKALGLP